MIFESEIIVKKNTKNLILLVSSIVADQTLILVIYNCFLYEDIISFDFSALIQIRFYVSQLFTFLSSWLKDNVNYRAFSCANAVDRVDRVYRVDRVDRVDRVYRVERVNRALSSANSIITWIGRRVWQIIYKE